MDMDIVKDYDGVLLESYSVEDRSADIYFLNKGVEGAAYYWKLTDGSEDGCCVNLDHARESVKEVLSFPLLSPDDIYNSQVISVSYEAYDLIAYNIIEDLYDLYYKEIFQSRVKICTHLYENFDGRRFMSVCSVWFDNTPVLVYKIAGREGRDEKRVFITNGKIYNSMCDYIELLYSENQIGEVHSSARIPELSRIYGYRLRIENGKLKST